MTREEIVEMLAKLVRENEKDRLEFCKNVGITLDEFYVKQCGDFEIEDMIRAFDNGRASIQQQVEKMKCCGSCRFSDSDTLNGTFCHKQCQFVLASGKCKDWEN